MKKLSLLVLAAVLACSCQQVPRSTIQVEVPLYQAGRKTPSMVTISGPEAKEWDVFDRGDAVMKYNEMPLKDKEILFETIARVYTNLPRNNTFSSDAINTGIWKEVTDKGVDLSFGDNPADWHPYLMYIHPIIIGEMTNFFIMAKDGSISNQELEQWKKAGCNVINARPDSISMAAMLARRQELKKAGIVITETKDGFKAHSVYVNWDKYRAEHDQ